MLDFGASIPERGGGITLQNISPPDYPDIQFTNGVATVFDGFSVQGGAISSGLCSFSVGATSYNYSSFRFTGGSFPTFINDAGTVTITPATIEATPEPSSIGLLGAGLLGVGAAVKRRVVS